MQLSKMASSALHRRNGHRTSSGIPPQHCSSFLAAPGQRLKVTHQPSITPSFSHATDVGDCGGWLRTHCDHFSRCFAHSGNASPTGIVRRSGLSFPSVLIISAVSMLVRGTCRLEKIKIGQSPGSANVFPMIAWGTITGPNGHATIHWERTQKRI